MKIIIIISIICSLVSFGLKSRKLFRQQKISMKIFVCLLFIFLISALKLVATSPNISRKTADSKDLECKTYQKERCRDGEVMDSDGRLCIWSPSNNTCAPAPGSLYQTIVFWLVTGHQKIYKSTLLQRAEIRGSRYHLHHRYLRRSSFS